MNGIDAAASACARVPGSMMLAQFISFLFTCCMTTLPWLVAVHGRALDRTGHPHLAPNQVHTTPGQVTYGPSRVRSAGESRSPAVFA